MQVINMVMACGSKIWKKKQFYFGLTLAVLIISISFAYSQTESSETVRYLSYSHLNSNLVNITYDEQADQYLVTGNPASLILNMEMKIYPVNYLYLDIHTSVGQPTNWKLELINSKGEVAIEQDVVLQEGINEIRLPKNTLWQINLTPNVASGETFSIEDVELRRYGKDIHVKKMLAYFAAAFLSILLVLKAVTVKTDMQKWKALLQEMKEHVDDFLVVLAESISWKFSEAVKRFLRSGIFLTILIYITYIQQRGGDDLESYFSTHMWIVGGLLLILAGLMFEVRPRKKDFSLLKYVFYLYLGCVLVSDFYLNKKFRYAGFGMLFMGGFFSRGWKCMKNPEHLMDEFKLAYKVYFVLETILCLVFRPYTAGVHYSGYFAEAVSLGIMMLIALVVFVHDYLKDQKKIWNGIGAMVALFFIWKTQKLTIVLITGIVIIAGAAFWIVDWMKSSSKKKMQALIFMAVTAILGAVCVVAVRKLLGMLPYKLSMQKTFTADLVETYEVGLKDAFRQCGWKRFFYDQIQICKTYLQQINFWGHSNLTKYFGETVWPANSIVMNLFRYGMAAGIAYGMMVLLYAVNAVKLAVRYKNFQLLALSIVGIMAAMVEVTEQPFTNIGWYLFYFAQCYLTNVEYLNFKVTIKV